ncbi:MAG: hypothetical protein Q9206_000372 [Seirophora lacunosa]
MRPDIGNRPDLLTTVWFPPAICTDEVFGVPHFDGTGAVISYICGDRPVLVRGAVTSIMNQLHRSLDPMASSTNLVIEYALCTPLVRDQNMGKRRGARDLGSNGTARQAPCGIWTPESGFTHAVASGVQGIVKI